MNNIKTAISGVKWSSFGTIGSALFQMIQISILTRFLPKESFGLVAMAIFVVNFTKIFVDMGMTTAILHRQDATRKEYSSIYWFNIFISVFLYIILFLCTPLAARFYEETELLLIIPILGTNLLLTAIGRQHRTILQKQFKFKSIALTELISMLIAIIAALILALYDFGIYSLVYSTLISSFISNSLFLILNLKLNPILLHFTFKETQPFLKIGSFNMGSQLLGFFSREIDILIIGKVLGAETLGVYSLSKQIVTKLYSIVNPIILNVLSPILSSIQKEKNKVKSYYLRVVNLLSTLNFPIYLLIIVLSKEILELLYGLDYAKDNLVLSLLAISYAINTISNPVGSLQIATGRTDIGFRWTIFRIIVTPPIIYLAALINIETVAAALAVLSIILIIPMWRIQLKPMADIKLKEYIDEFWKPLAVMLVLVSLSFIINHYYEYSIGPIKTATIKTLIFGSIYIIIIRLIDKKQVFTIQKLVLSMLANKKSKLNKTP